MRARPVILTTAVAAGFAAAAGTATAASPFISPPGAVTTIASTVPANGDLNPYGVAVVSESSGRLHQGSVLVSNFNAKTNLQGTGTTIVQVDPSRKPASSLFARIDAQRLPGRCPGGVGLTTALSVLPGGWVVVGSLPTKDGTAATATSGCLLVLDSRGTVRETIAGHGINGPWDMTAVADTRHANLFVTNVLNGTVAAGGKTVPGGTVLRIGLNLHRDGPPTLNDVTTVGSGFGEHTDPAALVVGPTGVAVGSHDTLYVADSVGNRITAIPAADTRHGSGGTGRTVTGGGALNTPLGLTVTPGGDLLSVNAGDGNLVETSATGRQQTTVTLDTSGSPPGAGALFGLATVPRHNAVYFVDDATNTLNLVH